MKIDKRFVAVGSIAALMAAACGSTVPASQQVALNNGAEGLGSGLSTSSLPPGAHVNDKGQIVDAHGNVIGNTSGGGSLAGTGGTTSGDTGSSVGGSGGSSDVATSGVGSNGPGITSKTIALGLGAVTGSAAGNQSIGASAAGIDYDRAWTVLVDYTNQHGGIGGLRIVPVIHNISAVSSESFAQQEQEECNDWTQDHHVFAGLEQPRTTTILACMQKAGGVNVSSSTIETLTNTPDHEQWPYYIEPTAMDLDTAAGAMVRGIAQENYFSKNEKLGLVTYDDPRFKYAQAHGLEPALRSIGVKLDDTAYLHLPSSYPEYGQLSNDAANAVLKFSGEGIDHVMFIDANALCAFFFMTAAARQGYTPRYGLNSESGNTLLAAQFQNQHDARDQLHGAISIGWASLSDTRPEDDPEAKNPTRRLCLSVMNKGGVQMKDRNAEGQALELCDVLWSFKAEAEATGSPLNQTTFLKGVAKVGSSYNPGTVLASTTTSSIHAGSSAVANMRFYDDCTCFKYVTKPYSIYR